MTTTATRPALAAAARRSASTPIAPMARPGMARPAVARPAVRPAAAAPAAAGASTAAFGLVRPTVVDARAALGRVYGPEAEAIWAELLGGALGATSAATVEAVVEVMIVSRHDIVRLCGQALQIRLRAHEHLSAAQSIVG